ncbi:serine hydroxymethyltransferase [Candidatus Ichthyocystis hellenicum]|uniref:serine hydroxymethyltransferase n=1 Tax=Candidatus Ichthyocystis hellenicum TaxID=1561003 RepID=UPI000AFC1EE8|nr:serine hydroxymethyltransferase [Candidatus Ichthyocystis hellenicum]
MSFAFPVPSYDDEVWASIRREVLRQHQHLELIASENYTYPEVMVAQGSQLTNKYAEGYPGKRYYGGCEFVDEVESCAIERLKKLFGCSYANVQPHSGSQANQAVFYSVLNPGDCVLGMALSDGGHLTHGSPVNVSGKYFDAVSYGLDPETEIIDYDQVEFLAKKHKAKLIIAGASSYSRVIDWVRFRDIADKVGAYFMADIAHFAGLIAAKVYPSPVGIADFITSTTHKTLRGPRGGVILASSDHEKMLNSSVFPGLQGGPLPHVIAGKAIAFKKALTEEFVSYQKRVIDNARILAEELVTRGFRVVSGGTDSHMLLVDLRESTDLSGKEVEVILGHCCITINKNTVPNETRSPWQTSGIRLGTPALTTRGFGIDEMRLVAEFIADAINSSGDELVTKSVRGKVIELCDRFPVYDNTWVEYLSGM